MKAAQILERTLPSGWTLTLIDQVNFITFNPLLPEVVGASLLPGHVVAPHRQMIQCGHVRMAKVSAIDTSQCLIHYEGEGPGTLSYDQLILACGAEASLAMVEGMAEHGLPLKTLGDALHLRNRIIGRLEEAELQPDEERRRWLTTCIIVGGGFSGVETAGALVDFLYASLRYYNRICCEDLGVVLLHSGERLLPELPASLGAFTLRKMHARGIDVRLNTRAARVTDCDVHLDSGELLAAGTVICTIGTQPNALLDQIPTPKRRGRLLVNSDLSVPGYRRRVGGRRLRCRGERTGRRDVPADGPVRRGSGETTRRQPRGASQRAGDSAIPLSTQRATVVRRPQQSGRGGLRDEALGLSRMAHVARGFAFRHSRARLAWAIRAVRAGGAATSPGTRFT